MSSLTATKSSGSAAITTSPGVSISNLRDEGNALKFTMSGVDTSIANGLRRIILSDIRSVVFRTFPHEECQATIHQNTTRMNNELIKQRLSCIPIHIADPEFPTDEHQVVLKVKNTEGHIIYATTKDFLIKNKKTDSFLTEDATRAVFPPDPISGEFIDIVRLRPNTNGKADGEEIHITVEMGWGFQSEDGAYNSVSTCLYTNTIDRPAATKKWAGMEKELARAGTSKDDIETARVDWNALEIQRQFKQNSFDFIIESVGVWHNHHLVVMGCDAMIEKLRKFGNDIQTKRSVVVVPSKTTIANSFDIILDGEDYTMGKVLEYYLYADYYQKSAAEKPYLSYCGFSKPHPHIDRSIIRIGLTDRPNDTGEIVNVLVESANRGIEMYRKIRSGFVGTSMAA